MKVYFPHFDASAIGGGWSWIRNFISNNGDIVTTNYEESNIFFIPSASMVQRDEVEKAMVDGKKVVLRCDNAIRNSRNRNTGMTRLKDFAQWSNLVIYQSKWAQNFLKPYTGEEGIVILNGVDTSVYNTDGRNAPDDSYLYVCSSTDAGKQWIAAWYWFVNNPGKLEIVGKFGSEWQKDYAEYNLDFFNNERFTYLGEQRNMADRYKHNKYFLYTFLNDACSNTLLEAKASGCEIIDVYGMLQTGGAPEIMACEDISLERMNKEYRKALEECLAATD